VYGERTGESCWATPLAVDDRIYLVGQRGLTTVVQAGREFRKLAENRLWAEEDNAGTEPGAAAIQYAVVAVPGRLLIRGGDALYCIATAGSE
jgi:hypothetical protein